MSSQTCTISVAPMEGITTFPMRLWLHLASAPLSMTTPFLRVTRVYPEDALPLDFIPELKELRGLLPYQLVPQFISGEPESFLRAAELIPSVLSPTLELNCGCPSPNSLGKRAGSGMLIDPDSFGRTIASLAKALGPGRLAIKMRLGLDDPAEFPDLLHSIADLPLARLTVHGRTRADGYRGTARWDAIHLASSLARAPVWASGDVWGLATFHRLMAEAPRLDGVMIGRGLLRNPWIFTELREGQSVALKAKTLVLALFCYALLQEIHLQQPHKLMQRLAKGRYGTFCGTEAAAWEKLCAELTEQLTGLPFVLIPGSIPARFPLSSVSYARLRLLWTYLRSSLPPAFADPALRRCAESGDFFARIYALALAHEASEGALVLSHQVEWDALFAGARFRS